jgi:hypothetical protein
MRLGGRDQFDHVLSDVAATVFGHVGCAPDVVADVVKLLNAAVIPEADDGAGFEVQFRAHAGACEVVVLVGDAEIWRVSRPIP